MATDELSERLKASFTRARAKLSAARHLLRRLSLGVATKAAHIAHPR